MAMERPRLEKHNCFGETPPGNFPDHLITPPNDNGFYPRFQTESLLSQIPSIREDRDLGAGGICALDYDRT